MSNYSIIELGNGKFQRCCRIQDGVERAVNNTKEEAICNLIRDAKFMNGMTITAKDIHFECSIPHSTCDQPPPARIRSCFMKELRDLINYYSQENGSNTPDFILAEYLDDCLKAFDKATERRSAWNKRT